VHEHTGDDLFMADKTGLAAFRGRRAMQLASMLCCLSLFVLAASCSGGSPESGGHSIPSYTPDAEFTPPVPVIDSPSVTPPPVTNSDWTMYHYDQARTGDVPAMADPNGLTKRWSQALSGAVYAEPLVVNGHVIVATEHDIVYSLAADTGQVLWSTSIGTPVPLHDLPCGNIDPLGITGTPVYDPQTGQIFAVAETFQSNGGIAHQLVGLDASTGHITVSRTIDPPGADARAHQERGALALLDDTVYVPFGGLNGDCSDYHGLVVGSRTDGNGPLLTFQVPTTREGGIWAAPGPVIDGDGNLYVAVGNGAATGGTWDHTDSVLRLSSQLQLEDSFAPQSWASDNAGDLDLGSMSPVLLPGGLIYADGKSSRGYLLQASNLGGVGGQIQTLSVCLSFGGAAVSGQSFFIPCTSGLRQLQVSGNGTGAQVAVGWKAPYQVTGSPVVGGNTVYSLDPGGGTLYALDASSGAVRAKIYVGGASRFATPTLYQSTVFVGTMSGVVAIRTS
jgi:outer membrane protein assembly factor BamB